MGDERRCLIQLIKLLQARDHRSSQRQSPGDGSVMSHNKASEQFEEFELEMGLNQRQAIVIF